MAEPFGLTVLEAQAYPGGCAGTFTYQGYRFDVVLRGPRATPFEPETP